MKSLILIDLSGIFWANWHATADQELSAAYERTVGKVHSLREGYDLCAVCCDGPPYKRKEISADYKAQRDAPPPQAIEQFDRTKRRLEADGLLLWAAKGYEADDVIATAVSAALAAGEIETTIASGDKDLTQLVDDMRHVRMLSPQSGNVYNEAGVREKHGVPPILMGDWLALVGDKSDNVAGVPGVGPKNAAALLAAFGDLPGVFDAADDPNSQITPKIRENLKASRAVSEKSLRLVTLFTDAPIRFDDLFEERTPEPLAPEIDPKELDQEDEGPMDTAEAEELDALISPPPNGAQQPPKTLPLEQKMQIIPAEQASSVQLATYELGLQPRSISAVFALSKGIFNSRLYSRFSSAEAIMVVILRGREMGMGALTALDNFHVIEGKPAPHAHLLSARAKAHPDCEYLQFVGGDHTYAEYETKNRKNPKPTRLKYTIEQAKRAGLVKSGSNWEKRPDEMLRKTCAVQLARIEYPESTAGLYSIEELGGDVAA